MRIVVGAAAGRARRSGHVRCWADVGRAALIAVALSVMVGCPMASAASGRGRRRCPPAYKQVLAADPEAVVYQAAARDGEEGEVYGCAYRSGRSYHFGPPLYGSSAGSGGTNPIALAGPIAAYGVEIFVSGLTQQSSAEIWVRDLLTGKVIHRMPNGSPAEPGDTGIGETTAIVVKSDGSVAWMARSGGPEGIQLRSIDRTGSHLLAASPEIEPDSLALAGSTLYWTQGGRAMSAKLE